MMKKINKPARTKFSMALEMDRANYKRLPWTVMYDAFTKVEFVEIYNEFRDLNNLPKYEFN